MTDSLYPTSLVCPKCKHRVRLDIARLSSITYTCEKCDTPIEQSFVTGSASIKSIRPPDESDSD